ncbi:hypothetical protein ACWD0Z_10140 [Streptomyces sp. NPDC003007]
MTMTGLWVVLGSLVLSVAWFFAAHYIDDRRFLKDFQRSRPKPLTPEEIFIGMRERKHDTMRRMREVVRDHGNRGGC